MLERIALKGAGKVIRTMRESRDMQAVELSQKVKWEKAKLSKVENDVLALSIEDLNSLAKAFNVAPETLVAQVILQRYPKISPTHLGKELNEV